MKAYIVRTDNTTAIVEFEYGKSYEMLKSAVGGWIECVSLDKDLDMWVNEEGKLLGLPVNEIATHCWESVYGRTDIIVGDVIFTGGVDEDGETLGLHNYAIARLDTLVNILTDAYLV